MEEQLRLLQEQFEEGYISEAVYNQRRQAIINQQGIAPTGGSESEYLANQNSDAAMDFAMRDMGGQPNFAFGQTQGFTLNQPQNTGLTGAPWNPQEESNSYYQFGQQPSNNPQNSQNNTVAYPNLTISTSENSTAGRTPYEFKTKEDYVNYRNESGYDKTTAGEDWDAYVQAGIPQQQVQGDDNLFGQFMPFFNPYGSNVQTDLYQLGSFLGMPKGAQGKGLGVASSATALGLGAGRTLMSGFANSRQTARAQDDTRNQMMQRNWRPQMQYGNTNYRGGTL